MQFNLFNSNQDDSLLSIEDIRALRLRKLKIENEKKARKYILEINKRYREIINHKNSNFLKNLSYLKEAD